MDDTASSPSGELVKASLTRVETLETIEVLWNPARYRLQRRNFLHSPAVIGRSAGGDVQLAGGQERFETELFLDTADIPAGEDRDARRIAERIAQWMRPSSPGGDPARVVFLWGPFRFAGVIESLEEEWIRFDPDGTPVRAWISLGLLR